MKVVNLTLKPEEAWDRDYICQLALAQMGEKDNPDLKARVDRRSLDARSRRPVFRVRVEVFERKEWEELPNYSDEFQNVEQAPEVVIIGAGPAGYFAALECLRLGFKPIVIERGKDVRGRRRDLRAIQQFHEVNPDSNYCFGEGGAGTYSDGKLYTRSHKRGNIFRAMKLLVEHGAPPDILIDSQPHIGSNKLPKIVSAIRDTILDHGGKIHFDTRVTDLKISESKISQIQLNGDEWWDAPGPVILATGHSARDIYEILHRRAVYMEAKPFALGVRVEHPQALIDEIQYNQRARQEGLPASSYKLVQQIEGRGVYSFCMCPGGLVVPAATAPGEIVTNGMSLSKRNSPYANSGIVVGLEIEDFSTDKTDVFAGLRYQAEVEKKVFDAGDGSQQAPAQRLTDLIRGKVSVDLPEHSYIPGLVSQDIRHLLPEGVMQRILKALHFFEKKMKGFITEEAVAIATESRTSSPIRIPRDRKTFMHTQIEALFPCGEGAGYAGGIISAALDGQNVAQAVARYQSVS